MPTKSNAKALQTKWQQTRSKTTLSQFLWPRIMFCFQTLPLQLAAQQLLHCLNLVTGKLTNKYLTSSNSHGFKDTHGGKIRLETLILEHLSKRNPIPTGSKFLVSTRSLDNVVRTTQQQATKIGNNSLPGSQNYSPWRTGRCTESHQVQVREHERAEQQEHSSGFVSNQDPEWGFHSG